MATYSDRRKVTILVSFDQFNGLKRIPFGLQNQVLCKAIDQVNTLIDEVGLPGLAIFLDGDVTLLDLAKQHAAKRRQKDEVGGTHT
jgi:hypothetical protein